MKEYYEVVKFIAHSNAKMVYFYPALNKDLITNDCYQHSLVEGLPNVLSFGMKTHEHGITFPKYCINDLWDKDWKQLQKIHAFAKPPMNIGLFVLLCGGIGRYFRYLMKSFRKKQLV